MIKGGYPAIRLRRGIPGICWAVLPIVLIVFAVVFKTRGFTRIGGAGITAVISIIVSLAKKPALRVAFLLIVVIPVASAFFTALIVTLAKNIFAAQQPPQITYMPFFPSIRLRKFSARLRLLRGFTALAPLVVGT